jgi:hypothetical protein
MFETTFVLTTATEAQPSGKTVYGASVEGTSSAWKDQ